MRSIKSVQLIIIFSVIICSLSVQKDAPAAAAPAPAAPAKEPVKASDNKDSEKASNSSAPAKDASGGSSQAIQEIASPSETEAAGIADMSYMDSAL